LLLVSFVLTYVFLYYKNVRRYPKGPFPLPLIGNLYHMNAETLHDDVHKMGKKYGHCFTLFMPRPIVIFTDYATVKEALITKGDHFGGRSHLPPDTYLQKVVQTGVMMSDGEVWKEQRRAALRILREHGMGKNIMEEQVNRSIDELLAQVKATNDGVTPYDMNFPIQLCVGNVINETLFGYHFKYTDTETFKYFVDRTARHLQLIKDNLAVLIIQAWPWTRHLPIIGTRGYKVQKENIGKVQEFIEDEVNKVARSYDTNQEPANFVQSYLREMRTNHHLDTVNLYAIVVDFWIAGMETTGTTLRWALLLLMKHPHVQERIRADLLSVVGRDRRIEMLDKPNLPYFTAAITEIQRTANMFPFLIFNRTNVDTVIGGKKIPVDTLTLPQIYSVMKDDPVFERPSEFLPERFLEVDGKTANKKTLERVIPFAIGKRICAGEALARMELFLV
ncbi:hypothetical protein PENTCL1PPCAC_13491, partial [Pristionchus entomophagus]